MRRELVAIVAATITFSGVLHAGVISQTLRDQLLNDRTAFEAELFDALADNNVTALDAISVPRPSNLEQFVQDEQRLLELGKALFWDMQISDGGEIACASCHNSAGADARATNNIGIALQLKNQNGSSVANLSFSNDPRSTTIFGPNTQLSVDDFPRNLKSDPTDFLSPFIRETNTIIASSGVFYTVLSDDELNVEAALDPLDYKLPFNNLYDVNTRRVRGRHVPTVINAVFNHRQLWNGLASNIFNGVTPFGEQDNRGGVYVINAQGDLVRTQVAIDNASLASQATGSPNNPFEMSTDGPGIGTPNGHYTFIKQAKRRRLLNVRPLAKQEVSPTDSVLGALARNNGGLKVSSYQKMIQQAFKKRWWASKDTITLQSDGSVQILAALATTDSTQTIDDTTTADASFSSDATLELQAATLSKPISFDSFTQIEMNFPLFFGLALYKYESTLVADRTPVDRFLNGDRYALNANELIGFRLAAKEARCLNCHGGGEFTFASVSRVLGRGITRDRRGDLIDEGFNNIGVTPTLDDLGVGSVGPSVHVNADGSLQPISLSFARQELLENPDLALDLGADGAFKIPTLRNVELTAPYFHNGGESNLMDVVRFYFRGGNYRSSFAADNFPIIGFSPDRSEESNITGLGILTGVNQNSFVGLNTAENGGLDEEEAKNIVAFLRALTDERVRFERAPFDHPQIFLSNGHVGNEDEIVKLTNGVAADRFIDIPAVGAKGLLAPRKTFMQQLAK